MDLCFECPEFPRDLLESNLDVVKFHCIETFKEEEIEHWIDKQLSVHRESS